MLCGWFCLVGFCFLFFFPPTSRYLRGFGNIHSAFALLSVLEKTTFVLSMECTERCWGLQAGIAIERGDGAVHPRSSFSCIYVLGFRHICECGHWYFISTFAESCIRVGLEREFDAQTFDEELLYVVTSELFIHCIEIKAFLIECSHLSFWLLFFLVSCVFSGSN